MAAVLARGRKRQRGEAWPGDGDGAALLPEQFRCFEALDAGGLLAARTQILQLQMEVERRLVACPVDGLTPREALEFIFRRRVRLLQVVKNEFAHSDNDDDDDDDSSDSGSGASQATGSGTQSATEDCPPVLKTNRKEIVVSFRVGGLRIDVACSAEGPKQRAEPRYSFELRKVSTASASDSEASSPVVLLSHASWDPVRTLIDWKAWEELRSRCGAEDRRPVEDFVRDIVFLGIFAELRRRFAHVESDSDDEVPGVVTTISVCGMMAERVLPSPEGRLSRRGGDEPTAGSDQEAGAMLVNTPVQVGGAVVA